VKNLYITIRPTRESLVRTPNGDLPGPSFVIEWDPRVRPNMIEVDVAGDQHTFLDGCTEHFEFAPTDVQKSGVIWRLPHMDWKKLSGFPRIFYRATARFTSGRTIHSLDVGLVDELPFLHGRQSDGFYRSSISPVALPRLRVEGATLLRDDNGSRFFLRGVNISGMNYARYFWAPSGRWRDSANITPELLDRLEEMHINMIRLPLNQDWLLMGYHEPELPQFRQTQIEECLTYLEDVDKIVSWAAERGMYVMLSLHTLRLFTPMTESSGNKSGTGDMPHRGVSTEKTKQPYNAHLPDHRSWLFWSILAQRYRGSPAVLFDLCNEPHEVQKWYGDSHEYRGKLPPNRFRPLRTGGVESRAWWVAEWKWWASALEELIHGMNPEALIFISGFGGPSWSSSLLDMDYESPTGNPNVILAVHWYWSKALGPGVWRRYLGLERSPHHPVFVAEWGVETPGAVARESGDGAPDPEYQMHWGKRPVPPYDVLTRWGEALAAFFADLATQGTDDPDSSFAGFAAWSTGDKPRIFKREGISSGQYEPGFPLTDYGRIVQKLMVQFEQLDKSKPV
jgi:hypothetical protein